MTIGVATEIKTKPYAGQKPGTSGLRRKVVEFQQPHYLANFVQSIFHSIDERDYKGQTILVSGDGRYWGREACQIIAGVAAANGVKRIWMGINAWCSTPAGSCIIRNREGGICRGGILLTASHNPGGPKADFGIKYNEANGAPAPETVTDKIYANTLKIESYKSMELPQIDFTKLGVQQLTPEFSVEIIDPIEDWLKLMKSIFDFPLIKKLVSREDFKFVYDGLNGIAGPYAEAIFVKEFGCNEEKVLRQCHPLEDFGGGHPDPNLTYAKRLVKQMNVFNDSSDPSDDVPDFGGAGDGDNDRNMILGKSWFVTPSDSVAIITHYATDCIPYFKNGLKGVARSMPTSEALRLVAEKKGLKHFEVPTGWKFFGNLMDADMCSICGEESFGTGSDHIREKDGLWAILSWLSIIAHRAEKENKIVSVKQINQEFWAEYGRNWYTRYDYEGVSSEAADKLMQSIRDQLTDNFDCQACIAASPELKEFLTLNPITKIDEFNYLDPVDHSESKRQGLRVYFKDGSRFVLRLSGTGSSGATIRLYLEKYSKDYEGETQKVMEPFVKAVLRFIKIKEFIGTEEPTVKT